MENAYARSVNEVLDAFGVDPTKGLTDYQVAENSRIYGENVLPQEESTPFWKLVLKQFDDLLVRILIAAAIISFVLALINGETGLTVFLEPSVIFMILAANAAVGVITETNAEKALEELRAYQADVATVLRNGCFSILPATELVPGDIVEVGVGCKVPADMRMIEMLSNQLRVDQAILTGESCSVAKDLESTSATNVVYQDKTNILFSVINFSTGRVIDKVYLENEVTAMDNDHTGQLIFSGDAHGCIYNTVSVNSHAGSISTLHKNRSVRNRSVVTIMQYHTFSLVARSPVLLVCAQDGSLCFFRELLWRYVVI